MIISKLAGISVETLKGVGPKVAQKLAQLSIVNLEDLLFHLPFRYQDKSRIHPIGNLYPGQTAQVFGVVEAADIVFGKRRSLVCKISDGTGILDIRLFYFSMAQKKQFVRGHHIQCYGQVSYSGRNACMIHPQISFLKTAETPRLEQGLSAVYPTTEGLQQRSINAIMQQALRQLRQSQVNELLPDKWLKKLHFPPLSDALQMLHRPPLDISLEAIEKGQHPLIKRLAFEELVAQHIALQNIRQKLQQHQAQAISYSADKDNQLVGYLPFQLTRAQQRVIKEIRQDIEQARPMMRLVQGDVGSGKTLVAAFSMLQAAANSYQSALMAPTEILAEQHYRSFCTWFNPMGYKVVLLTSKMPAAEKKSALEAIAKRETKLVIGTHALFQAQVVFDQLALVVIDEQHRFGVEQRKALLEKSRAANQGKYQPHQLVMTATPIPRTLAQTAYADLDISVIDELPPGRKPIITTVVNESKRDQLIERVRQASEQDKRQVYWVCTLINESEELQCQAAEVTLQQLKQALPELNVGLLHGRMKSDEKQRIMAEFKQGEIDLLVATTVIEVGVDVPNANLMVIENPERLGLSQLHQLRGRVGRGEKDSHCLLMYQNPLSQNAKQRLQVMRETNDGFVVAEKDLELRGPGEVLGTRQTGALEYKFADIVRDSELLPEVYLCADEIIQKQPAIAQALCSRWVKAAEQLSRV